MQRREIKFRAWNEFPKYEIGDDGSIWSMDYNHTGNRRELKQYNDDDGYKYVFFVVNSKRYKRSVHRMVAISFIENVHNKPQVNHIDGIRFHNSVSNLEWCTSRENTIHGYASNGRKTSDKVITRSKLAFGGINNPKAKVTPIIVCEIKELRKTGYLLKEIASIYKISIAQVSAIINNKSWKNERA